MKKWGALLVAVSFASIMMWKFSGHSRVTPAQVHVSSTAPDTSLSSASQAKGGASFATFKLLVEQSREQSKKCKEDLLLAIDGLNELRARDPKLYSAEMVRRFRELAKVPIYPVASQQALQMIENGVPADWDGELLTGEISQLGDCTTFEHYDAIKDVINDVSGSDGQVKQEAIKTASEFLKSGIDAPLPLIIHLVRIDVLESLQTHGLVDSRYAGKIKALKNEAAQLKEKLVHDGQRCASQPDRDCWKGYPFEIANSKKIREHYRALVLEALP